MKKRVVSFDRIGDENARILLLGSMPGEMSLAAGEYYAHPRNAFWKIIGELTGFEPGTDYAERLRTVTAAGIAVWDVLRSCHRRGSLDTSIELDSLEVNDFGSFFDHHPLIEIVCFNGGAAERCYRKHVLPSLKPPTLRYARLPSSSPAHASLSFEAKLTAWRATIGPGIVPRR